MGPQLKLVIEALRRSASGVSVVVYLQMLFVVISAAVMHMLEWQDPVACEAWVENETASPL